MKLERTRLTLSEVLTRTANNRESLANARQMVDDPEREKRLKAQECILCFYSLKAGGSAVSYVVCGLCDEEVGSGSTNVPRLCPDCARAHRLCGHCGGDLEMKGRRKV